MGTQYSHSAFLFRIGFLASGRMGKASQVFDGMPESVLLPDVVSDPEVLLLEQRRKNSRAEEFKQSSPMQGLVPSEMDLQGFQNPKVQVPEASIGVQDGKNFQALALESLPMEQDSGESWEVQDQALAPSLEQRNQLEPVYEIPEASSNPKRRRGRPPKGSAPRYGNPIKQNRPRQARSRIKNFILPHGWLKQVRGQSSGGSAGNNNTYYVELCTQHVCWSPEEVMAYIANKEKDLQMRNQDVGGIGVHSAVDADKI